ncbi:MAG: hypothetical protein DRJ35_05700 [Thermoprotei archaeon]|nr:MAG: hypothetical protein DRJ35_05700 [Thermoprotei archaeon]
MILPGKNMKTTTFLLLITVVIAAIIIVATWYVYTQLSMPSQPSKPGEEQQKPTPPEKKEEQKKPQEKVYLSYSPFKTNYTEPEIVNPNAPQYSLPLKLEDIYNKDQLRLDNKALKIFLNNGFVVIPGHEKDLAEIYIRFDEDNIPIVITTDSVLFLYHSFYETILIRLEKREFIPTLTKLLKGLLTTTDKLYKTLEDKDLKAAAKLDVAYLSVPLVLLDPKFSPPDYVKGEVFEEVSLILHADKTMYNSPIFGYREDYTQYKPRGHYTESEEMKNYFRAMMWLGRMRFEAFAEDEEKSRLQTLAALLLAFASNTTSIEGTPALKLWYKIYLPTAFMVGESDDPTIVDYIKLAKEVYGELSVPALMDKDKLDEFRMRVKEISHSKIQSSPIFPEERSQLVGLRFMGQRFILDGYIHQQLCHSRVKYRFKVKGLDVMAALGSDWALKYLEEDIKKYPDYKPQLEKLREEVSQIPKEEWYSNLYMGWLYAIKALLEKVPSGYPTFMQTDAWLDKNLNTAHATWAQLRHDTILYAKQPYAELTAVPPKKGYRHGFVEPNPKLYARLKNLVEATLNGLKELGLLDEDLGEKLVHFRDLLAKLEVISEKELGGESLTEEEISFIRSFGHEVSYLLAAGEERVRDPRIVADVYTDPNSGMVLEVATGYFDTIIVAYMTPDGRIYAGFGAVMSYYEFYWPQTDRLTDEQWRSYLEKEAVPPRPLWTSSYLGGD